jgi:ureidoacrylate peracid hydrolase
MRDYRVTLLGDACAAQTPRLHELGLEVMSSVGLATVVSLADGYQLTDPIGAPREVTVAVA